MEWLISCNTCCSMAPRVWRADSLFMALFYLLILDDLRLRIERRQHILRLFARCTWPWQLNSSWMIDSTFATSAILCCMFSLLIFFRLSMLVQLHS